MVSLNSQALIAAGRQIDVPFEVALELAGKTQAAHCTDLLRLVPGKRVVVKMRIGDTAYLAKIFLGSEGKKYCQRELKGIQALQDAGVSTAKLAGQGCLSDKNAEVLLLEYLPAVRHLSEILVTQQAGDLYQLDTAVAMLASMHANGLLHKDCHLDNFLVNEEGLYLIDGDAVQQYAALSQTDALQNLALFFVQLPLIFNAHFAALFADYCKLRGLPQDACQSAFDKTIQTQRETRQRRFLKKIYRNCTQFKVEKDWSRFVAHDRQADSAGLQMVINNLDEYIEKSPLLKDGSSATVAKIVVQGEAYVVKRYNLKGWRHWLTRFWRPSRAWMSWRNAQLLQYYGIGTPKALAMIEQRCGALRGKAYFITEYLAADNASSYVEKHLAEPRMLAHLAEQFAQLFEVMKLLRFSHGDFKASNFLVSEGALSVIDLDSMKLHSTQKSQQRALSKDQQRFMKNWRGDTRVETAMTKSLKKSQA